MNKTKLKIYLNIILIILVCLPAINSGLINMIDIDIISIFGDLFGTEKENVTIFIYLCAFFCAVILLSIKDTYLPFLGFSAMPVPQANTPELTGDVIKAEVSDLPINVKVLFWAAKPSATVVNTPEEAYGDYSNQGVTTTDKNGKATFTVKNPAKYTVPYKGTLDKHIHYRYWSENGIASEVHTVTLS